MVIINYLLKSCSTNLFIRSPTDIHAKTAKVLILLVVPGHLIFIQGIKLLQAGHTSITPIFLQFYLLAALIQVFVLLYIAQIMIFWMW